jgi:hypothetical protein
VRIAYLDCFSGASGDMLLGALVDAGWPAEELERLPARLGLAGVEVHLERARRGILEAQRVEVRVAAAQPPRHLRHVREILERADLPPTPRERALGVFAALAEAEASVHGASPESVHFHEVGAADALVDVAGVCLGLERLAVESLYASALPLGRGTVRAAHGVLPIPAPATARLLRGVPVEMPDIQAELVTPTGAALLAGLVDRWGYCPPFTVTAEGLGAGARDLAEQPNVLRLFLGDTAAPSGRAEAPDGIRRRRVVVLETAIDDAPPQHLAPVLPKLLAAGALDAFLTAIVMKKGRPALLLTCLCEPGREASLARLLLEETPTLGVRSRHEDRFEVARRECVIETPHGPVRAKVALLPGGRERLMPEFESLAQVAERNGIPLHDLARTVQATWESETRGRET